MGKMMQQESFTTREKSRNEEKKIKDMCFWRKKSLTSCKHFFGTGSEILRVVVVSSVGSDTSELRWPQRNELYCWTQWLSRIFWTLVLRLEIKLRIDIKA